MASDVTTGRYNLTQRGRAYLAIRDHIASRGIPPTMRDLQEALGVASVSTAEHHVMALEREGLIERDAGKARAIRIAGPGAGSWVAVVSGKETGGVR